MRNLKPIYLSTALALVLASCGGAKQIISTPVENIDTLPLKVTPLAENDLKRWSHLDLVRDTVPGMSVDKAYSELLKNKKGSTVIVGIVDSGVDIRHEDLQGVIWVNPKEIAGNGIDDDKNGYIDDINNYDSHSITKKGSPVPSYHFEDRLFDRDTLFVHQYKINFLYVLKSYSTFSETKIVDFRDKSKEKFRNKFVDFFNVTFFI